MWAYVVAANDNHPITDAYFSHTYFPDGNGNYNVIIEPYTGFWCDAPNYQTTTGDSGVDTPGSVVVVKLPYVSGGPWPQTY